MPNSLDGETPDQLTRRVDAAIKALQLVRSDLDLLHRIGEHAPADPFPSSVRPKDGGRSKNPYTPTEAAALRGWPGDDDDDERPDPTTQLLAHDPVGDLIWDIFKRIATVDTVTHGMEARRQLVHRYAKKIFGRQDTTSTCLACKRTVAGTAQDPNRKGYCDACRKAWDRYVDRSVRENRDPSRIQFANERELHRIEQEASQQRHAS